MDPVKRNEADKVGWGEQGGRTSPLVRADKHVNPAKICNPFSPPAPLITTTQL